MPQTYTIPISQQATLYKYFQMWIPHEGVRDAYVEISELIWYVA
jgi:hypothetical protein